MYGKGTLIWANGVVYKDGWKENVRYGIGTMTNASGGMYSRIYNRGVILSSKPFVTLINGPPSQLDKQIHNL